MTLKLTPDEMKLMLFYIKPHLQKDPEELSNKDAIWVYILKEIVKKIFTKIADRPLGKKHLTLCLKTYQIRAFKEILDNLDFLQIGEQDPWQYAVLTELYNYLEQPEKS